MKNYERFFSSQDAPEPPPGLAAAIMVRIVRRERRILIMKIAATACVFAGSLAMIWIGFADFRDSVVRTGFLQIGSLLFSDFSVTMSNLPDFALSMLEAFPVCSASAILFGAGFAVWSGAAMVDEIASVDERRLAGATR